MDQRIRLLTAAAVMLSGLGFALFFRRPAAENDVPIPLQSDPLVLRKQPDPRAIAGPETLPAAAQSRRALPTIVAPSNQAAVPPELARTYPDRYSNSGQIVSTRWGASLEEMLPEATSAPATHKVIDGDSLALLALRVSGLGLSSHGNLRGQSQRAGTARDPAHRRGTEDPQGRPRGVSKAVDRAACLFAARGIPACRGSFTTSLVRQGAFLPLPLLGVFILAGQPDLEKGGDLLLHLQARLG